MCELNLLIEIYDFHSAGNLIACQTIAQISGLSYWCVFSTGLLHIIIEMIVNTPAQYSTIIEVHLD